MNENCATGKPVVIGTVTGRWSSPRCQVDSTVQRILERLTTDIRDRHGLKHAWAAIPKEVMNTELRPAWERLLTEEISELLNQN